MCATRDDAVLELVRLALGTAAPAHGIGPIDADLISRATQLGVVAQVIAAGEAVGFTDEAESIAATAARARSLRGAEAETMAWRVHRLLSDARVPALALKGVALAAMTGRTARERAGVDTDVLVQPLDWPRAHDAMVRAGYTLDSLVPAPRDRDSLTKFMTFSGSEAAYIGPGGPVDVHWRLVPGHCASLSTAALLARAVEVDLAGGTVPTLDPDAMLAHIALHGAKDRWQSLRTLVDAHLLVTVAGATWKGAAALVGSSTAVSDAKTAVESAILGTSATATATPWLSPAAAPESLRSFLARRAALTPSGASLAAVAAGMLLPRDILARSPLPRRVWWLAIGPRIGRAMWWGVRAATGEDSTHPEPSSTMPHTSSSLPERPSTLRRYWGYANSVVRDLVRWYPGTPSRASTYGVVRKTHVRTGGVSSVVVFSAMRAIPGAADHVGRREVLQARDRAGGALAELRQSGLAVVDPVLDAAGVASVREFAQHAPAKLQLLDGRVINGTYADRHPDAVSVFIAGAFALANSEVQHVMASRHLHNLALARWGLAPVVHMPSLYWSCVPAALSARRAGDRLDRAARFHVDFDGVQAIRVHTYLTDVDEGRAPMQYVPGSHRVGSLYGRKFRTADNGVDARLVTERFGASAARSITGPAGTTFVTDPRGLHRATAPSVGDRLFLVMAIRGGAFAGAVHRRRAVPVRDEGFRRQLDVSHGPLRLFEALADDRSSNAPAVGAARLA